MRFLLTGSAILASFAALASLGKGHSLSPGDCPGVPSSQPWAKLGLKYKRTLSVCNLTHARSAIRFIHAHRAAYAPGVASGLLREHRALRAKARRNLAAINRALHPHVLPGWFIALCECETQTPVLWTYDDGLYHGGPNFLLQTWYDYGGRKYAPTPEQATPWEQYLVTLTMHADVPWSQSNPACSARVGLR